MTAVDTPTTVADKTADRQLLVDVHRWARANGWTISTTGWINAAYDSLADIAVGWDEDGLRVWRKEQSSSGHRYWPIPSTDYPVATVRQAVDVLVALRILPVHLSSAYRARATEVARLRGRADRWCERYHDAVEQRDYYRSRLADLIRAADELASGYTTARWVGRYDPNPTVDSRDPDAHAKYANRLDSLCPGWHWDDLHRMTPPLAAEARARRGTKPAVAG